LRVRPSRCIPALSWLLGQVQDQEATVGINPNDAVAQTRLGTQYLAAGHHEAMRHFQEAVRLSPSDQTALNGLQRRFVKTATARKPNR